MKKADKFEERFQKRQERSKLERALVSPDEPPLPDTPVEQAKAQQTVGRNDPCPCGSGRKYKKCCGRDA